MARSVSAAVQLHNLLPDRGKGLFKEEDIAVHCSGNLDHADSGRFQRSTPCGNFRGIPLGNKDEGVSGIRCRIPDRNLLLYREKDRQVWWPHPVTAQGPEQLLCMFSIGPGK